MKGFFLNYIGICIGSIWAFLLARHFGQEFVLQITGNRFFEKYSKYLVKENHFEKIFAILLYSMGLNQIIQSLLAITM